MNPIFIGVIILLAAYAFNRSIMKKATKDLDDDLKLKIFEAFSTRNNYATFFILGLAIVFFGALQFYPQFSFAISIIYLVLFAFYLIFRFTSNYKKLKQIEVPKHYMQSLVISYAAFIFGFLGFAGCFMLNWFR